MVDFKKKLKKLKLDPRPLAALDTETNAPAFWNGGKPFYVSTCDELGNVKSWQWDVDPFTREPHISSHEIQALQEFVDGHRLVFHNAKFDIRALNSIGVGVNNIWESLEDTLVASHVVDNSMQHGLKYLCEYFLGIDTDDQKDLRDAVLAARRIGKRECFRIASEGDPHFPGIKFSGRMTKWCLDYWLPRAVAKHLKYQKEHSWWNVCARYADQDAVRTMGLWQYFDDVFNQHPELRNLYNVRKQALHPFYAMEEVGLTHRESTRTALIVDYNSHIKDSTTVAKALVHSAGGSIDNLGSFKQLQTTLFDTLNVPHTSTTKTGFSVAKEELAQCLLSLKSTSKGSRFIKHLMAINQRKTAVNYLESYGRFHIPYPQTPDGHISEEDMEDLRVLHPSINLTGTRTTRQASSQPNGQNISHVEGFNLRSIFGPAPGRVWYSVDYANIELRILAYESDETELIRAFERGESVHMKFANVVCPQLVRKAGGPRKFKKTQQYHWVKNGDFALTYGGGRKLVDATYHIVGAYNKVRGYFTNLDTYMKSIVHLAESRGYITTRMSVGEGYPLYTTPGKAYTQAVDYICQGTAGWALLIAVIEIHRYLQHYPDHHLIMTIHDELLFDFPANHPDNEEILSHCCHLMRASGNHIAVPLDVEAEIITTTWDKGEPVSV